MTGKAGTAAWRSTASAALSCTAIQLQIFNVWDELYCHK